MNKESRKPPGRGRPGRLSVLLGAFACVILLAVLWLGDPDREGDPGQGEAQPSAASAVVDSLPLSVRLPAEFEPQDAMLVGPLPEHNPTVFVDLVTALHKAVRVVCLVGKPEVRTQAGQLLLESGLPAGSVVFMNLPVLTMWARDFGPIGVEGFGGELVLIDGYYGPREGNEIDDTVPESVANLLDLPRREVPLHLEGGDFVSNGQGLCLSTTRLIERNESYRDIDAEKIGTLLGEYFGFREWIPVAPLEGEPTGHADIFLTFVAPDVVVVGSYDPEVDAVNADRLDQIAAHLASTPTEIGYLRVERIPMPPHDDGQWRTYTNVVFANGTLVVPASPDLCPDLDRQACEVYARLLPDWRIVSVDISDLIAMNGTLRCVTMNLPRVPNSRLRLP